MERLSNSAYELNTATRFGRFDVALGLVEREVQPDFVRRHSVWGKKMRVVDLEVQSVRMTSPGFAQVQLEVTWHRQDQTTIRVTQIHQKWKEGESAWLLADEERVSGDAGVFGKRRKKKDDKGDGAKDGGADANGPAGTDAAGSSGKEAAGAAR